MTPLRSARLCSFAAVMSVASVCRAGVWAAQPVVGASADYASNPALLNLPDTAESHAAILIDAPTTYTGDAFKFSILPSFRLSNSQGYSSLDSNYGHLTAAAEFDTQRSTLTATGLLSRDSSLYHDYLLSGYTGVRRDSAIADLNWDEQLTERFDFDTDVNSTVVHYAESAGGTPLVDYKYSSLSGNLGWAASERTKLTFNTNAGRYNSLDGTTGSKSLNFQLGFVKKLSEIWTLTASAGYSRANNEIHTQEQTVEFTPDGPTLVTVPVTEKSTQNGTIYSINVSRQTPRLAINLVASRQLVPSGFAFLSLLGSYELKATYNKNERLSFSGDVHRVSYKQPETVGQDLNLNTTYFTLSADWRMSERWTLTMNATRVTEDYVSPSLDISSNGLSIKLSRQLDWKSFQ
jgi:hypothetical protein